MAEFWLRVMGSAAIASLVVTGVMACEGSLRLTGLSKQRPEQSQDKSDQEPPDREYASPHNLARL
ncbi:hypothetical protein AA309_18415 [Microvirga vignae]|uniref:Lipoprotein n=1 Tax=Microvirga vignae TaxID=1225564 RepID=A0A0H1RA38_9HYPH|nr:hypothetical protein [Microvirga vignae]KLK91731.1 hypothetical protein AA309_18415 [Microvirga vignae]